MSREIPSRMNAVKSVILHVGLVLLTTRTSTTCTANSSQCPWLYRMIIIIHRHQPKPIILYLSAFASLIFTFLFLDHEGKMNGGCCIPPRHVCCGCFPSCSFYVLRWLLNYEMTHYCLPLLWKCVVSVFVHTLLYLTTLEKVGFCGQNKSMYSLLLLKNLTFLAVFCLEEWTFCTFKTYIITGYIICWSIYNCSLNNSHQPFTNVRLSQQCNDLCLVFIWSEKCSTNTTNMYKYYM